MVLTIELTEQNETLLSEKAARFGKTVPEYVRELLRPYMTPPIDFDNILKPLHDAYKDDDRSQEELVELIHQARRDVAAKRSQQS